MILDKVLLLKGLGGLSACAGLSCGAAYIVNPDLFKTNEQILNDLISKVGLTGCDTTNKTCNLPTTETLKLYNADNEKVINGKVEENKKLKYEEGVNGFNKGFKFYVEEEVSLCGDNSSKKIAKKESSGYPAYEIREHTEGSTKTWYLSKVTTAPAS